MKKLFSLILILLGFFFITGCGDTSNSKKDKEFAILEDELFLFFLGTDPLNINFSLYNPEQYGLEDAVVEPYEFSMANENAYFEVLKEVKIELQKYKDNKINKENKLTKKIILDYIDKKLAYEGYYYFGTNLGSYLGYQSQLPLILAEYRFDREKDIENYFSYLEITQTNFESIISFEKEKANEGMEMANTILSRSAEQCYAMANQDECYLIPVFNDKIDNLSFLNDEAKASFKRRNVELIENKFLPAYVFLGDEINKLQNDKNKRGNLAGYENGNDYYELLFQDEIGTNVSIEDVEEYLNDKLEVAIFDLQNIYRYHSKVYNFWEKGNLMEGMALDQLIPFFIEKVDGKFPSLKTEPDYSITEISSALSDFSSPAMYFLTPIDGSKKESIYINPKNVSGNDSYTYQVIAHEGYPGHLLQHVYLKQADIPNVRKVLSFGGYSEGWATYVENYVVSFIMDSSWYLRIFEIGNSLDYLILGLADIYINYYNYSISQFERFINTYYGPLGSSELQNLYYDLIEVPTNYLKYYYSYYKIQDMKTAFKEKMGNKYSDLLFHTIYLETGPCSLDILEDIYVNY